MAGCPTTALDILAQGVEKLGNSMLGLCLDLFNVRHAKIKKEGGRIAKNYVFFSATYHFGSCAVQKLLGSFVFLLLHGLRQTIMFLKVFVPQPFSFY